MKKGILRIVVGLMLLWCNALIAQNYHPDYLDGQLYVKLKDAFKDSTLNLQSPALAPFISEYGIDTIYRPFADLNNDTLNETWFFQFSNAMATGKLMEGLRALPMADYVEQIPLYRISFVPNDVDTNEYHIPLIDAERAWDITRGSSKIVVAIVDNAIFAGHEDLFVNMEKGYDVADNDNNTSPPPGFSSFSWCHGTHCSGIAAGVTDNRKGLASIGYNTHIMPIKTTHDTTGNGDFIDFPDKGVAYAISHGANIISLSWGGWGFDLTEQVLINAALERNIVVVAAAGNNDTSKVLYPSAYNGVICVGATDMNDVRADFSNYGSRIDVMAPGVHIFSTFAETTDAYAKYSGTSMSCPMVAGLAALVLALHPDFTPAQVRAAIIAGADDISLQNPGFDGMLGTGRINAYKTLSTIISTTGTDNLPDENRFKIYPNPFTSKIRMEMEGGLSASAYQLLDMQGRITLSGSVENTPSLDLEATNLPSGMYLLRLITSNGISNTKLVKM